MRYRVKYSSRLIRNKEYHGRSVIEVVMIKGNVKIDRKNLISIVRIAIGNLSCFQLPMQILFGMPEDRRKCIPSMVTIMEISVYLEITRR